MNRTLLATAIFALVAAAVPSHAQQATTKDQLIGSWRVLSLKATTGDKIAYPLGEQVAGYVTITSTRFWLLGTSKNSSRQNPTNLTRLAARGNGRTERASHGAEGLFRC